MPDVGAIAVGTLKNKNVWAGGVGVIVASKAMKMKMKTTLKLLVGHYLGHTLYFIYKDEVPVNN